MPFRPSSRPPLHPDDPRRRQQDGGSALGHDPLADPADEALEDPAEGSETELNEELGASDGADDLSPETDPEEGDESAQRFTEDRVKEDMATAAVHPQTHVGGAAPVSGAAALAPGAWSQLSDAEIMLRVAAGDEAGFSLWVGTYRRQRG